MAKNAKIGKSYPATVLAVENAPKVKKSKAKVIDWASRPINTTRKDIRDWRRAMQMAEKEEEPMNTHLQTLYTNIANDGLLSSQIENRITKVFNVDYSLVNPDGETNEEQTNALRDNAPYRDLVRAILETHYYEYSMVQLQWEKTVDGEDVLKIVSLPRMNIAPQTGRFYYDIADTTKFLDYRNEKEYGIWWLEFGDTSQRGLLNKAVPHILMKSFSQSCWAELCEIYGIPPRYMKTNTQDPQMLNRADKMMKDMGAAAYFIIDETEEFQFADGIATNGDVYKNLITLCNNEVSMMVSGAIIGQDTKNGNYSKEESSQEVLWELIMQDLVRVEENFNRIVIPALRKLGVLKGDVKLKFDIPEDLELLWTRVKDAMNYYEFDTDWLNEKFGMQITGVRQLPMFGNDLSHGEGFFV